MLTAYPALRHEEGSPAARKAFWVDLLESSMRYTCNVERRASVHERANPQPASSFLHALS
jgi:hypothetical protein